ncbi:MAG: hypothetical protein H7840_16540 [Alphaproteobacteria bacterium]
MSDNDTLFVKTGSTFAALAYGDSKNSPPSGWRPIEDAALKVYDQPSGLMARVYVKDTPTKEIWIAVAGTNDLKDVAAYPAAYLGETPARAQILDALTLGQKVKDLVNRNADYNDYTVNTSGHSWGELLAQTLSYTFGYRGVGFDGVGAKSVVSSSQFVQDAQNLGITVAGSSGFISCNTAGVSVFGGGLVGSLGFDIPNTRHAVIQADASTTSGLAGL